DQVAGLVTVEITDPNHIPTVARQIITADAVTVSRDRAVIALAVRHQDVGFAVTIEVADAHEIPSVRIADAADLGRAVHIVDRITPRTPTLEKQIVLKTIAIEVRDSHEIPTHIRKCYRLDGRAAYRPGHGFAIARMPDDIALAVAIEITGAGRDPS